MYCWYWPSAPANREICKSASWFANLKCRVFIFCTQFWHSDSHPTLCHSTAGAFIDMRAIVKNYPQWNKLSIEYTCLHWIVVVVTFDKLLGLAVMSILVQAMQVLTCCRLSLSIETTRRMTLYALCWVTSTLMHLSSSWLRPTLSTWPSDTDWCMAFDHTSTPNNALTSLLLWQQKLPTHYTKLLRSVDSKYIKSCYCELILMHGYNCKFALSKEVMFCPWCVCWWICLLVGLLKLLLVNFHEISLEDVGVRKQLIRFYG